MRRKFLMLILIISSFNANSQSYFSQRQTNVIVNITNYNFRATNYISYNPYPSYSMFDAMESILSSKQKKYDYAIKILSTEIRKLRDLELINDYNNSLLETHKNRVVVLSEGKASQVDFSIYSNFTEMLNYVTWIYTIQSVKSEMNLLTSINNELYRIKIKDPDNFYKSERYKELGNVLNELKTISHDSIPNLSWKYGLL